MNTFLRFSRTGFSLGWNKDYGMRGEGEGEGGLIFLKTMRFWYGCCHFPLVPISNHPMLYDLFSILIKDYEQTEL